MRRRVCVHARAHTHMHSHTGDPRIERCARATLQARGGAITLKDPTWHALVPQAPTSGPSTSSASATVPAGRVLDAAPEPSPRPRSRAGAHSGGGGSSSSGITADGVNGCAAGGGAFKEGWANKWSRPRSRLGLEELASGGSAVAQLLLAAEALGDDDEDNCCPTCLEAYTDSGCLWLAG